MKFCNILKELRQGKNLTHQQLANELGFSRAVIGFWESGNRQPASDAIIALATFFDVSADYLLGLENEDGTKIRSRANNK